MSDTQWPIEHEQISTGSVNLHVATAGPTDGPLVILLHGFPEFWYGWRRQIPVLASAGFHVLAPDQRGYNTSDKPPRVKDYSIDRLSEDVIGLIDHCGRETAMLVGHDWGGAVTWWTAARFPDRIARLSILNVPHPVVMRKHLLRRWSQMRKSWYMFFFQLPWLPERRFLKDNSQRALRGIQKSGRRGAISDEDLEHYRAAWQQPGAMQGMINWYRAMFRAQAQRPKSYRVKPPTLVIWGKRDAFIGHEMAPESLELCDDGRLEFIDEATHWVQHEEPERVNRLLVEHLTAPAVASPAAAN